MLYSLSKDSLDFPGGSVMMTSPSNAGGMGAIPGRGARTWHALGPRDQNTPRVPRHRERRAFVSCMA